MAATITAKWVVNASPLICLGKIGRLDWLAATATQVVIPSAVAREIAVGPPGDAAFRWLESDHKAANRQISLFRDWSFFGCWRLDVGASHSPFPST